MQSSELMKIIEKYEYKYENEIVDTMKNKIDIFSTFLKYFIAHGDQSLETFGADELDRLMRETLNKKLNDVKLDLARLIVNFRKSFFVMDNFLNEMEKIIDGKNKEIKALHMMIEVLNEEKI